MILNMDDFWECPTCRLQAHTATEATVALLPTRGSSQLKDTKATARILGWYLTKADPKAIFKADPSGFDTEEDLREFLKKVQ